MKRKPQVHLKTYARVSDAVEKGVRFGYHRAFKHMGALTKETIVEYFHHEVMVALDEVIDFAEER